MGSRKDLFYKNLIIDEEDRPLAERYLASKGVEKHLILKEKLFNWIEGDKIEYSMIASTYRYDKRLRLILFKYISYLEEFYRAVIFDAYRFFAQKIDWIDAVKQILDEFDGDLNSALERMEFSTLLKQADQLSPKVRKRFLFPRSRYHKENSFALKELRNAVMHNKFLLFYRGFEPCYIAGVDDGTRSGLRANILNLIRFLPNEVAEKCRQEINAAKEEKSMHQGTKWNLPPFVAIHIY